MKWSLKMLSLLGLTALAALTPTTLHAQPQEIPELLRPWQGWVTWDDPHRNCPTPYNNAQEHICFWPSRLALSADARAGSWNIDVTVYAPTWVPLPGSDTVWPQNVRADGAPIVVVQHEGAPSVHLPPGRHQLAGKFAWDEMPQRIAIPRPIGLLTLNVDGSLVAIPNWDTNGDVWLKRAGAEVTAKDSLAVQVYRVLEDGIPIWLRTQIDVTVSGQSREEELGWVLPDGWILSLVDSPIPVAVDERGRMKVQVRAGKWSIRLDAFRTSDLDQFQFAADAVPIINSELIGFRAQPEFRMAEIEGIQAVDVTQTTFPEPWRNLPVYQWDTRTPFRLTEKMRGMGVQRPEGLTIERRLWLDEDGRALTSRDQIRGRMQQIWRLDVAEGQELGAVRVDGKGQLITANPQTGAHGVEIRTRNLDLEAVGRAARSGSLLATGWQTDVDSLSLTLVLPPGWRVFALFGADRVEGDWLTAWSLLDLFLLLIFALAVSRLWGLPAGIVALLAFGLAYHEPGAPRIPWLFLLMPLALLRVVGPGTAHRWITIWKYLAVAVLVICLVPFLANQIQTAIFPQLERPGIPYGAPRMFWRLVSGYRQTAQVADEFLISEGVAPSIAQRGFAAGSEMAAQQQQQWYSKFQTANLAYDPKAKIQTGPAEPEWNWIQVRCRWDGPVSATQTIRPILISQQLHRLLTVARVVLLAVLTAILLGGISKLRLPFGRRAVAGVLVLGSICLPSTATAQIPDATMLDTLRKRLLEPSDAYPNAAEITSVSLRLSESRIVMESEIHTAIGVAVPLPGRLPAWSPLSVRVDDEPAGAVCRKDDYLWVTLPQGVHRVVVEGLLPESPEWEWAFLLRPRRVAIDAPGWTVTGVRPNGVPEAQVFFVRQQQTTADQAAYDRKEFQAIVLVNRQLEVGLIWQLHTEVTRLSSAGKAVSLQVPLLENERVLTPNVVVASGLIDVRLGAGEQSFAWDSELPVGDAIRLQAQQTDRWVERWHLLTSPVWNTSLAGLSPVFESQEQNLIPVWHPWPGEVATLSFSQPEAVSGATVTVQRVNHETELGSRLRTATLKLNVECSLGNDFALELDPEADISSLKLDDQTIQVRRDGAQVIVPLHPGKQSIEIAWRSDVALRTVASTGRVALPVEGSNVTSVMRVPERRWVLWASGPLRGPAVRFWAVLVLALLLALGLGSLSDSPLSRIEWILLALGLTQVHVIAALVVVVWFFALARRGKLDTQRTRALRFDLLQIGLVVLTAWTLAILIVVVRQGLLGNPRMFIIGNQSSPTYLQWFQPRVTGPLPEPQIVSISVWFYRLLMLGWALWLAGALLRWLKWGWAQFTHGEGWKRLRKRKQPAPVAEGPAA